MSMSNTQAVRFALTPGAAEALESYANSASNLAWYGAAKAVKYTRNALYVGVALTTIAAMGASLTDSTATQYACTTLATLSVGFTTLAAKRLYDATSFIQGAINSQSRL
jgi:hypothetical protein